ncbi:AbrB/MazE/SpoVT family DNA-binding domain-containing protein [Rhizobium sp. CFBP 8762]|uniref:AbrB/MazE/SpoVT family DNA-binding domain-containing protein n=1 Tax=Rhizobium sp. CFBP 8762 TaxID=2775279 RepID=UPI00177E2345|nr:AbrB/MazE/SpoVT family DNA-binding domain-containing protein [Rhizobium sp. CFBP 8762]MBD8555136.1 AbrB/MazE/SpoVT family DNA-binding domain-containing protein [Rhizobium sp. CFBP 8762]
MRYSIPLQENGRLILPADIRRALNLKKGDRVIIDTQGDRIELTTAQRERRRAQMLFRSFIPSGEQLVDQLINDRRAEALEEDNVPSTQAKQP